MTSLFGSELRRAREAVGWSREQLAEEISFSLSLIEKVEAGSKSASEPFAEVADRALKTDGLLQRMRQHGLRQEAVPEWFRPWSADVEERATRLRSFEPLVVPGLVQTAAYATELLGDETKVAARLDRQKILTQERAPEVVVVLDEAVLRRRIGSPATMAEQLRHLAEARVCVQILPQDAGTYMAVDGSLTLATLDGREVMYVCIETVASSFVVDDAKTIAKIGRRWDTLRGEALPQRQSRQLIMDVAEEWQSRI